MLKRMLAVSLIVGGAAWVLSGCGGGSSKPPPPPVDRGGLITLIGDAPVCDVLAFRPTITKLTLTPQGSTAEIPVFATTPQLAPNIKVNLANLRDFSTVLNFANVQVGTYDMATITLQQPQLVVFDSTQSPPTKSVTVNLSTSATKFAIQPPLHIVKNMVSVLRLDFDLLGSLQAIDLSQPTVNVTPTFQGTALSPSGSQGFGEMDDIVGFVQRVDTVSASSSFIGDIQVQLLSASLSLAPSILVNLTKDTKLLGVSALDQLPTGNFVEIDGFIDMKGNIVANTIEVEDRENVSQNMTGFIGIVTSATKDSSGNVTQFSLYVGETEPDVSFSVPLDSVVVVKVSSSTGFHYSSPDTNFTSPPLAFDATALTVGQEVVVHGTFTVPPSPKPPTTTPPSPTTVAANDVYLKLQTVQGNFSSLLLPVGSDDKTGAFQLAACPTLLQGTPLLVLTNSQTAFVNVSGLSALTPRPILLIKGLPFFERLGTTINGVAVPPGTLVLLAKQVHQLL